MSKRLAMHCHSDVLMHSIIGLWRKKPRCASSRIETFGELYKLTWFYISFNSTKLDSNLTAFLLTELKTMRFEKVDNLSPECISHWVCLCVVFAKVVTLHLLRRHFAWKMLPHAARQIIYVLSYVKYDANLATGRVMFRWVRGIYL